MSLFESGRSLSREVRLHQRKLQTLESKLWMPTEALAELLEEHVRLRKALGKIERDLVPA